jgi:hypothetical protein
MRHEAARFVAGNRAILRSVPDDGTQWYINLRGVSALGRGVNVKDSNAGNGKRIRAVDSIDSGNNFNWDLHSGGMTITVK